MSIFLQVADFQTDIDVVIYEGERPMVDQNNKLGEFLISGVERAKAGTPQVGKMKMRKRWIRGQGVVREKSSREMERDIQREIK